MSKDTSGNKNLIIYDKNWRFTNSKVLLSAAPGDFAASTMGHFFIGNRSCGNWEREKAGERWEKMNQEEKK